MRSRAEVRRGIEWLLRAAALGLLGWCVFASMGGRRSAVGGTAVVARLDDDAARQLAEWTRAGDLRSLHVALDDAPDAVTRDWLRALEGAGTEVAWSGQVPAVAIAVEAVADPRGGTRVDVAAPDGAPIALRDGAGRIDSLTAAQGGASVVAPTIVGSVTVATRGATVSADAPAARTVRDVIVLGRAGWEAKFVTAALEEQGWRVRVRMPIAPGIEVRDGITFDTARASAVVALDSAAARDAGAIARFVRSGGGLVLGPEAAALGAFAALAPGRVAPLADAVTSYAAAMAPVTRERLPLAPIASLHRSAVVLERRGPAVTLAARRIEAGRVVQVGYDETWRWRMAGRDDAPEAHRRWWSGVVGAVGYAPVDTVGGRRSPVGEAAPLAALVAALGAPEAESAAANSTVPFDPSRNPLVYLAIALLLLAEWTSRRLRGAK